MYMRISYHAKLTPVNSWSVRSELVNLSYGLESLYLWEIANLGKMLVESLQIV